VHINFSAACIGVLVIGFGRWLGGEMVYVKEMAVETVVELASLLRARHLLNWE